jgi:hypothetical protein
MGFIGQLIQYFANKNKALAVQVLSSVLNKILRWHKLNRGVMPVCTIRYD